MNNDASVGVLPLGQVGFRLQFGDTIVYIDPYLSDNVAHKEGPEMQRLFPVPFAPDTVVDADWVLVTHEHVDHCDPETLQPLSEASSAARFMCPPGVRDILQRLGIPGKRIVLAQECDWLPLADGLRVIGVPAAHPRIERDTSGYVACVGYVLEYKGRSFYHAGDTSIEEELLTKLIALAPIEVAFLPVNERNYFRDRRGIIGNMSVREAFTMAEEIGVKVLVPTHWDMFSLNSVTRGEIELLYKLLAPRFELSIYPEAL